MTRACAILLLTIFCSCATRTTSAKLTCAFTKRHLLTLQPPLTLIWKTEIRSRWQNLLSLSFSCLFLYTLWVNTLILPLFHFHTQFVERMIREIADISARCMGREKQHRCRCRVYGSGKTARNTACPILWSQRSAQRKHQAQHEVHSFGRHSVGKVTTIWPLKWFFSSPTIIP